MQEGSVSMGRGWADEGAVHILLEYILAEHKSSLNKYLAGDFGEKFLILCSTKMEQE